MSVESLRVVAKTQTGMINATIAQAMPVFIKSPLKRRAS